MDTTGIMMLITGGGPGIDTSPNASPYATGQFDSVFSMLDEH